jgi:hypothetical protein
MPDLSLIKFDCLPRNCAELKCVSVRIRWPPACNSTPVLAEATEHGGITLIHNIRRGAVMELNESSLRTLSYLI